MIVEQAFLNKLKDFGLNTYESKLWTALLSRGSSTAGELSDIANVPRSRSYDVLESLEKKGFVIMKLGKPIKYVAVPPSEVVDRIKKKVVEDSEMRLKLMQELKTSKILSELSSLHGQGMELVGPLDLSGSLQGRDNIYNHLISMIKNANSSVILMTTEDGLARKADSLKLALAKAKQKNVKVRILAPLTKKNAAAAKDLAQYAEVKHTDRKGRFCIVDNKELFFMLMDDASVHPTSDIGIWVNTDYFASTLLQGFEEAWMKK